MRLNFLFFNLADSNCSIEMHGRVVMTKIKLVTEEDVSAKARVDGMQNSPDLVQDVPGEYESYLLGICESQARDIVANYSPRLEKMDGEIQALEALRKEGHEDDTRANDEIHSIKSQFNSKYLRVQHAQKDLDMKRTTFENWYAKANRMPVLAPPLYYLFAGLIGIGEIPLNAMVFKIFGEGDVMTWVMAALIGLIIPLGAHFVGIKVREHGDGFSWSNAIKAIVVAGFVVGGLYAVSVMREAYLGSISEEIGLADSVVQSSIMFFWLNAVIFVVAITIAYSTHESIPEYANVYKDLKKAEKELERAEHKNNKALSDAGFQRVKDGRITEQEEAKLQARLKKLCGEYDKVLAEGREKEKCCLIDAMAFINLYRRENINYRRDKGKPKCFENELGFPLHFTEMTEKLPNENYSFT